VTELKKLQTVATILERELDPTIQEWLRLVNLVPELTSIPLSDADRTGHLPKLFSDLVCRLRLATDERPPISAAATAHGKLRFEQGYSTTMVIEESRLFQVATFGALQRHQTELDQSRVLSDVVIIADEVDFQLKETVRSLLAEKPAEAAA
jgi:hypothetical protein